MHRFHFGFLTFVQGNIDKLMKLSLHPQIESFLADYVNSKTLDKAPIDKHRDEQAAQSLRKLIHPFIKKLTKDDVLGLFS